MRIRSEYVAILALLTSSALASAATGNDAVALGITYQRVGNTSSYEITGTFDLWIADTTPHNFTLVLEHWRNGQRIATATSPQLSSQGVSICLPCNESSVCTPVNGCIIAVCSGGACFEKPVPCEGQGPCQYANAYYCACHYKEVKQKSIWEILFGDTLKASVSFQGDVNPGNDLQTMTVGQLP